MNGKQMADSVLLAVRSFVDGAVGTVSKRMDALELRMSSVKDGRDGMDGRNGADGLNGKDGRDGIDGKDGAAGLNGKDGINGKDGTDGRNGERGEQGLQGIQGEKGERGEPGAAGADGVNGKDGRDGIDGKDGAPGLTGKDGAPGRDGVDGKPGIAGERGEKGVDGRDGLDGKDGAPGINGKDGAAGLDGKSITLDDVRPMLEAEVAKWELDFERRSQAVIQRAIDRIPVPSNGRDGRDGEDGRDGFNADDFDAYMREDGRTLVIKMQSGDLIREREIKLAVPIYRGVYKQGEAYAKGDTITYGGSLYIAQTDSPASPGDGVSWKLAVKKGADAK